MKKMKKWISAILTIAMVAGLFGSPARNALASSESPDIVPDNGWSININYDNLKTRLATSTKNNILFDSIEGDYCTYTRSAGEIAKYVAISGIDMNCVSGLSIDFDVFDEAQGIYTSSVQSMNTDSRVAIAVHIGLKPFSMEFYDSTYLSKLTTNGSISTSGNSCDGIRACIVIELGTVGSILADDIVSDEGWSIDLDLDSFGTLLDGKTNSGIFEGNYSIVDNPEIVSRYLDVNGLNLENILDMAIEFLVYDEEYLAYDNEVCDIDENSKVAVGIHFVVYPNSDEQFKQNTYLAKLSANVGVSEEESHIVMDDVGGTPAQLAFVVLELGTINNILHSTPAPTPTPDPTYVEWNTDDPNVTKLMWHGGKFTYATIAEKEDSTDVVFTGIGWFALSDALVNRFSKSGKNLNVTYPYKGYTVTIKVPAGEVKTTDALWYGPEYFPSLYMEDGYVTVTDYLGREVDPQVIITC